MNILLISNMYPSKKAPNYGVFVKNTEDILKENGFRIDRIVLFKENNKILKLVKYILFYFKIIFAAITKKYDFVYVHYAAHCAIPLLILNKVKPQIKICTNLHGSDVEPQNDIQRKLQKKVGNLLRISTKIIVPSNYFKKLVSEKYNISKDKIYVFPSGGINTKVFYPLKNTHEALIKLNLDNKFQYLGYVGRIDYKKGWDILLESIFILNEQGYMHDKKLLVVGNGSQVELFKKKVSEYKLDNIVIWHDFIDQTQLVYVYNAIDVFCFPSLGESLGLVGLEAMACGTPIIGSKVGGLTDYIEDNINGMFFKTGNSDDLKNKVIKYFKLDKGEKLSIKNNAVKTAERYGKQNVEKLLIKIFYV